MSPPGTIKTQALFLQQFLPVLGGRYFGTLEGLVRDVVTIDTSMLWWTMLFFAIQTSVARWLRWFHNNLINRMYFFPSVKGIE